MTLRTNGVPLTRALRHFLGYPGSDRDTKRRRSEEALRDIENDYRTLIETTGAGFLILDSEGRVIDANLQYVMLTGHEHLAEIVGRNVLEWTAAHDQKRNLDEIRECLDRGFVR